MRARVLYVHAEKAVAKLVEDSGRRLAGAVGVEHVPDHPELRALELPDQRPEDCRGGVAVVGLDPDRGVELGSPPGRQLDTPAQPVPPPPASLATTPRPPPPAPPAHHTSNPTT